MHDYKPKDYPKGLYPPSVYCLGEYPADAKPVHFIEVVKRNDLLFFGSLFRIFWRIVRFAFRWL